MNIRESMERNSDPEYRRWGGFIIGYGNARDTDMRLYGKDAWENAKKELDNVRKRAGGAINFIGTIGHNEGLQAGIAMNYIDRDDDVEKAKRHLEEVGIVLE